MTNCTQDGNQVPQSGLTLGSGLSTSTGMRATEHSSISWSVVLLLSIWPSLLFALTADESVVLERARAIAAAPIDDFSLLGEKELQGDAGYRYQLAFLSYSLCSVVQADPALRSEGRTLFTRLVEKMERPKAHAYWRRDGYPGDGLKRDNVMYRGHLNLMYGLAHDRFEETRFDEKFHTLSRELAKEIGSEHPVCCEPDILFIQCNSVAVLSLWLHDRAYGTSYATAGKRLLTWAGERMPLAGTRLVRDGYRLSTGKSSAQRTGYANAWVITFLSPLPELQRDMRTMYADWKRTFVEPSPLRDGKCEASDQTLWVEEMLSAGVQATTFGLFRIVKGAPAGEALSFDEMLASGLVATTFGALAARAQGDELLHRQLTHTVAWVDALIALIEKELPAEQRVEARTYRAIALFARTFRGWNEVFGTGSSARSSVGPVVGSRASSH
jgi:hypothetical protein